MPYTECNIVQIMPATGFVAAYDCDGELELDPVICWAVVRQNRRKKDGWLEDEAEHVVIGMVMEPGTAELHLANDVGNFVGYQRADGTPEYKTATPKV